ncbi:MAG: TPM domain-containing protein [Maritimibacter sp.]
MRFLAVLLLGLMLPQWAAAQSWPVYQTMYVNDYAGLIDEDAHTRLTASLRELSEETGIEATVLTLNSRKAFQKSGSLESFATGLFNAWGIGNAETNDGILILVLLDDKKIRIELGSGYASGYDSEAQDIINTYFLPAFKSGEYSNGIEDGTFQVIERIARANFAGEAPKAAPLQSDGSLLALGSGLLGVVIGAVVAAGIAALIFGRKLRDRFTRCPNCGTRGVRSSRKVLTHATRSHTGRGEHHTNCPRCGYADTTIYTIPIITSSSSSSSSSGGSFGGGSSSGGGASGSW